ncbi:hypothetical protein AMATHDRAFT_62566 [Amanita thiersii Skay4041]|uniref:Uncharacterized protein n=1 Tax=Amanita thiersii Skay4041 TaxID=703135 RepID=A0A2A9NPS4_9AGAR|nr:hypothetical protein AMATHDRAFT_62566 [Amanita thiersii Skay4041]
MSREELVHVAESLNAKLPRALFIDVAEERPASFIRNAIEVLVGIQPEVPSAPLRVSTMKLLDDEKARFFADFSFEDRLDELDHSASPLARRSKPGDWSFDLHKLLANPRRLERLEEETEEDMAKEGSYRKKRRRFSSIRENDRTSSTSKLNSDVEMGSNSADSGDSLAPLQIHDLNNFRVPVQNKADHVQVDDHFRPRRILRSYCHKGLPERISDVAAGAADSYHSELVPIPGPKGRKKGVRKSGTTKVNQAPCSGSTSGSVESMETRIISTEMRRALSSSSHDSARPFAADSRTTSTSTVSSGRASAETHMAEKPGTATPFLSVRSTFSSISAMSIDPPPSIHSYRTRSSTHSSRAGTQINNSRNEGYVMSTRESCGTADMDISM